MSAFAWFAAAWLGGAAAGAAGLLALTIWAERDNRRRRHAADAKALADREEMRARLREKRARLREKFIAANQREQDNLILDAYELELMGIEP